MRLRKYLILVVILLCGSASLGCLMLGTISCTATHAVVDKQQTVDRIQKRGYLLVGTTGDYRPLSFREPDGNYWGFGIEMAGKIAERLGGGIQFVPTSWPTLSADVMAEPQTFDLAIGGITITEARREMMLMSDGYLANGKTILCRAEKNEEIPSLIAEGEADVMITEITEAPYYVQTDTRLAAPLLNEPFTNGEIGVLMRKGQEDLLQLVNNVIHQMKSDGSLRQLHEKYGLVYAYE